MACFDIRNLSFTYPNAAAPALRDVSLTLEDGELLVLCGPSGCGKTTLLRTLKPALAPVGDKTGEIRFAGAPLEDLDTRRQAREIGFVQQDPDNQLVTDKVWHELAFTLESLGLPTPEIRRRAAEMAAFFGIEDWYYRDTASLSGGQKQLLNLASVMAAGPKVLLLDEPTSQLDPIAAAEFLSAVARLNRELGVSVLLTEHRLEEVLPLAHRAAVLDGGRLLTVGTPAQVGETLRARDHALFDAMPAAMRVWAAVPKLVDGPAPVTVAEGRSWLHAYTARHPASPLPPEPVRTPAAPSVTFTDVWFRYEKDAPDVLRGLSLEACPGEVCAILGGNGTGKTTALTLAAGLLRPQRGRFRVLGEAPETVRTRTQGGLALLPQDPRSLFVGRSVREELSEMLDGLKLPKDEKERRIRAALRLCRLTAAADRHPYDLSGGEQQRAALAKVLLREPQVLLLDEPTKGFDAGFKRTFAAILKSLTEKGVTVVMISHDVEFCARYADRCALLFDGQTAASDRPRAFFSGLSFYTTAASRMARDTLPGAVTAEEIIAALGGEPPDLPDLSDGDPDDEEGMSGSDTAGTRRAGLSPRAAVTLGASAAAMLATLAGGMYLLGDRRYYLLSLLLLLEAIVPFYVLFERRRPQARELVLLAVLCAIGVAGRAAFFMLPSFKPLLALVILCGVATGGESGFLIGATAALVSNFFFGQGPWTPWQMFTYGFAGLLSGVLYDCRVLPERRGPLAVWGVLCALLYGGVMNPAAVLMYQPRPTLAMLAASYATGLPVDLVHAAATAIFLWVFSRPFLEKIRRIRVKYGLIPASALRKEPSP